MNEAQVFASDALTEPQLRTSDDRPVERWLTIRTLIAVAIGATIGFPLLALLGIEIESGYVTALAVVLAALTVLLVWLSVRRLLSRLARRRRGR